MRALFLTLLFACHSSLPTIPAQPDPRGQELVLGVGDVIAIDVWDQKDLKTDGTIRPDGTITMPLVGDLHAAGMTPTQLKAKIKEELGKYLKLGTANEVTVAVKSWKSYKFTLAGEIGKPGVYGADQYVTVAEAIAIGGGLTRFANHSNVRLLRGKNEFHLDYDDLASGKRPDMNFYVLPGDTIYIP